MFGRESVLSDRCLRPGTRFDGGKENCAKAMPSLTINGKKIEAAAGRTLLEVALENGIYIPHFCYHPRLKVAGNCRMCLVEIEKMPKLQISCATRVAEGMVVHTESERVKKARRAIMEFLLINHPLDCTVCDECGECRLQDYSFQYGRSRSRYREPKRRFPRLDIGPDVVRDMNRCIHCTRCIRFLRDLAGDEEFCLSERGPRVEVGTFLQTPIRNQFSLNLAEVCPVGALTSRHFRFQGRPWLMQKVRTICTGCSRGCNAWAWISQGRLVRLTPAPNEEVNLCWLCNPGHMTIKQPAGADRPLEVKPQNGLQELESRLVERVAGGGGRRVGLALGADLTNEEIYLLCRMAREFLETPFLLYRSCSESRPFLAAERPLKEWFIRALPANQRGLQDLARHFGYRPLDEGLAETFSNVEALIWIGEDRQLWQMLEPLAGRVEILLALSCRLGPWSERAQVVLPLAHAYEKDGTLSNEAGRVQRLRRVLEPAGEAQTAWEWIMTLAPRLGLKWKYRSFEEIYLEIAASLPGYENQLLLLGDEGLQKRAGEGAKDAAMAADSCKQ